MISSLLPKGLIFFFQFYLDVRLSCLLEIFPLFWGKIISLWTSLLKMLLLHLIYFGKLCFHSGGSESKEFCNAKDLGSILGWEDPLEKRLSTHSSIPAWRILGTEEPGGLQSTKLQRAHTTEQLTLSLSFNILLFNHLWLCWVFVAAWAFP